MLHSEEGRRGFLFKKNIYVIKCKACVSEGSSQSSGFITTLRTDVDVDWTKAETSPHHQDMMDFPLTQDQPVDSDLRTSHCVNITHHQWHQRPHMCLNGTLIVFSPLFVRLSFFLSFCDGEQDALTARVRRRWTQGEACSSSPVGVNVCWRSSGCSDKARKIVGCSTVWFGNGQTLLNQADLDHITLVVQSLLNFHFRLLSNPSIHLLPLHLAVSWGSYPRALLTNRFLPLFPSCLLFEQIAGSCCRCALPPPNHILHFPSVPSSTAERSLLSPPPSVNHWAVSLFGGGVGHQPVDDEMGFLGGAQERIRQGWRRS